MIFLSQGNVWRETWQNSAFVRNISSRGKVTWKEYITTLQLEIIA